MFLVNYSSSSDSEDDNSKKGVDKECILNALPNVQTRRILLPQATSMLGKRKIKADADDDPAVHDGRIRSFKHERGNWATYIYIPVNKHLIEDIQDICHLHLGTKFNFKLSNETHISLTKTVVLQYHLIESFVGTLETVIQNLDSFPVSFNNLKVYTNGERTRTFLALKVDNMHYEKMLKILHEIDSLMNDFKLETFYEDPSFHVSILWCVGDCVSLVNTLMPTILESLKERLPLSLKIDKLHCKSGFKKFYFNLK